jgi:hypothetical protein
LSQTSKSYEFSSDVLEWIRGTGLGRYTIGTEFEDVEHAPGYVLAYPVAHFESPSDALAFKMRWL